MCVYSRSSHGQDHIVVGWRGEEKRAEKRLGAGATDGR